MGNAGDLKACEPNVLIAILPISEDVNSGFRTGSVTKAPYGMITILGRRLKSQAGLS
jgi:hypothetical protein